MSIDKLAAATAGVINNSKAAQNLFRKISENSAKVSVATANTANFVARPILTMASSINKWDGAYSSSSSIASGISETLTSKTLLKPFQKSVNESVEQLSSNGFFNSMGTKFNDTPDNVKGRFVSAIGRMCLIVLVPVNGVLKMLLHPKLAKGVHAISEKVDKGRKLNINA